MPKFTFAVTLPLTLWVPDIEASDETEAREGHAGGAHELEELATIERGVHEIPFSCMEDRPWRAVSFRIHARKGERRHRRRSPFITDL